MYFMGASWQLEYPTFAFHQLEERLEKWCTRESCARTEDDQLGASSRKSDIHAPPVLHKVTNLWKQFVNPPAK